MNPSLSTALFGGSNPPPNEKHSRHCSDIAKAKELDGIYGHLVKRFSHEPHNNTISGMARIPPPRPSAGAEGDEYSNPPATPPLRQESEGYLSTYRPSISPSPRIPLSSRFAQRTPSAGSDSGSVLLAPHRRCRAPWQFSSEHLPHNAGTSCSSAQPRRESSRSSPRSLPSQNLPPRSHLGGWQQGIEPSAPDSSKGMLQSRFPSLPSSSVRTSEEFLVEQDYRDVTREKIPRSSQGAGSPSFQAQDQSREATPEHRSHVAMFQRTHRRERGHERGGIGQVPDFDDESGGGDRMAARIHAAFPHIDVVDAEARYFAGITDTGQTSTPRKKAFAGSPLDIIRWRRGHASFQPRSRLSTQKFATGDPADPEQIPRSRGALPPRLARRPSTCGCSADSDPESHPDDSCLANIGINDARRFDAVAAFDLPRAAGTTSDANGPVARSCPMDDYVFHEDDYSKQNVHPRQRESEDIFGERGAEVLTDADESIAFGGFYTRSAMPSAEGLSHPEVGSTRRHVSELGSKIPLHPREDSSMAEEGLRSREDLKTLPQNTVEPITSARHTLDEPKFGEYVGRQNSFPMTRQIQQQSPSRPPSEIASAASRQGSFRINTPIRGKSGSIPPLIVPRPGRQRSMRVSPLPRTSSQISQGSVTSTPTVFPSTVRIDEDLVEELVLSPDLAEDPVAMSTVRR